MERKQYRCPNCKLLVFIDRDGQTLTARHEVPQCVWFSDLLAKEVGPPDRVTLDSIEVDE
jgi:hypothetical protein